MGDDSYYQLETTPELQPEILAALIASDTMSADVLTPIGYPARLAAWHDSDEWLKRASMKFSWVLFTLKRFGETPGDITISFAYRGKTYQSLASIVWPEFDPESLS